MLIDHNTTIEQYEAWLATNPTLAQFAAVTRRVYAAARQSIDRIKQLLRPGKRKRERVRSSLAGKRTTTQQSPAFKKWRRYIRNERQFTTDYLAALEVADIYDLELRQEETLCEALEILTSNKPK